MDAATHETVAAVVASCARRYARAWASIAADEFSQQGWVIALEAMPGHDPDKGPLYGYIRGAVMRGLFNFAHGASQPVRTPRHKEHLHWAQARYATPEATRLALLQAIDPYPRPDAALAQAEIGEMVEEAVGVATRSYPSLRDVLLGDATPMDLAERTGEPNTVWQRRVRKARGRLRDNLRIPRSDIR